MVEARRGIPGWFPFGLRGLSVAVVLLVGLQALQPRILARFVLPTAGAQWIWIAAEDPLRPVAFHAAKEFDLPRPPSAARLLVLADEEAVVFLNDSPVAAVRYVDHRSVRAYDVQTLVRRGRNRLLAELRSSRGVGGFLLRLEVTDAQGRREIVSDSTWEIHRRQLAARSTGPQSPAAIESPRVWGFPPVGRWALPWRVHEQPTILQQTATSPSEPARRYRVKTEGGQWQDLAKTDRSSPALGSQISFDWGREVVAYLAIRLPQETADQPPISLLFADSELPRARQRRPDAYLLAMPGQTVWLDAAPRRFRYLTILGLSQVSGADAYLVDPTLVETLLGDVPQERGVFGLRPPNLGTSLENEIRDQLQGLASDAGKESG